MFVCEGQGMTTCVSSLMFVLFTESLAVPGLLLTWLTILGSGHLLSLPPRTVITGSPPHPPGFYLDSRDPNSGPHICTAVLYLLSHGP